MLNPKGAAPALELGDHPLGKTLRSLDLLAPPVVTTWIANWKGSFGEPEKL